MFVVFRGLGTEVCRRSEELAVDFGCTYTYAIVTGGYFNLLHSTHFFFQPQHLGLYSQKIFEKLGHTTDNRLMYNEFVDKNGELYLKDTREHTSCITCYRKLV